MDSELTQYIDGDLAYVSIELMCEERTSISILSSMHFISVTRGMFYSANRTAKVQLCSQLPGSGPKWIRHFRKKIHMCKTGTAVIPMSPAYMKYSFIMSALIVCMIPVLWIQPRYVILNEGVV